MAYLNRIEIIGNLGHKPEIKNFPNGKKATFSVAVSEKYKINGEVKENTNWFIVVFYNKMAEVIANLDMEKGTCVYVGGKMTFKTYENANGEKRFAAELVGENLQILSTRRKYGTLQPTANAPTGEVQEDELPF